MSSNAVILELAKQLAALQEENKALKEKLAKPAALKKKSKKQEQFQRVSNWVDQQYAKGWEKVCKEKEEEIRATQKSRPGFVPVNDCEWPWDDSKEGNTQ